MTTADKASKRYFYEMMHWTDDKLSKPIYFLVNIYLVSSFLYYQLDTQVLEDHHYDRLCKTLVERWNEIADNPYVWNKSLLEYDALVAGSGFHIKRSEYPEVIIQVAYNIDTFLTNHGREQLIDEFKVVEAG